MNKPIDCFTEVIDMVTKYFLKIELICFNIYLYTHTDTHTLMLLIMQNSTQCVLKEMHNLDCSVLWT